MAKDHGITSGGLKEKIDRLHADGHISAHMRDAATEIRFAGNDAAHGDDVVEERPGIEDAGEIVGLMDSILERVYQEPARIAKIRAKREGRKQRELRAGDRVSHERYGPGTVLAVEGQGKKRVAEIDFGGDVGVLPLAVEYEPTREALGSSIEIRAGDGAGHPPNNPWRHGRGARVITRGAGFSSTVSTAPHCVHPRNMRWPIFIGHCVGLEAKSYSRYLGGPILDKTDLRVPSYRMRINHGSAFTVYTVAIRNGK